MSPKRSVNGTSSHGVKKRVSTLKKISINQSPIKTKISKNKVEEGGSALKLDIKKKARPNILKIEQRGDTLTTKLASIQL
jgi:hypothetical protein